MTDTSREGQRGRRLEPEVRKTQILNATAKLVAQEGLSAVSMERVGREAEVSKALVYTYFDSRIGLLKALRAREQERLVALQQDAALQASTYAELVRSTTRNYLEHMENNGVLLNRLMSEPSVAEGMLENVTKDVERTRANMAGQIAEELNIPIEIAELATCLCMGLTGAAGEAVSESGCATEVVERVVLSIFDGGLPALTREFGKS